MRRKSMLFRALTFLTFIYFLSTFCHSPHVKRNERYFIAANLHNSEILINSFWGNALIELVHLLGPENTFVSIFDNDSNDNTAAALENLRPKLPCNSSVISESVPLSSVERIQLSNGTSHIRRVSYLSLIRNRLFDTFDDSFDKIIFLNDIYYKPSQIFQLLDTNNGQFSAACGLDYSNPFKFYDLWATKDSNGLRMGKELYPYFGPGPSRQALLRGIAVPVKSCWSGLAVFDAAPFKSNDGVRFRALEDPNLDASECCLIHADIDQPERTFINPNVRVAYNKFTFEMQKLVRWFEILFFPLQALLNHMEGLPQRNDNLKNGTDGFCTYSDYVLLLTNDRDWEFYDPNI